MYSSSKVFYEKNLSHDSKNFSWINLSIRWLKIFSILHTEKARVEINKNELYIGRSTFRRYFEKKKHSYLCMSDYVRSNCNVTLPITRDDPYKIQKCYLSSSYSCGRSSVIRTCQPPNCGDRTSVNLANENVLTCCRWRDTGTRIFEVIHLSD